MLSWQARLPSSVEAPLVDGRRQWLQQCHHQRGVAPPWRSRHTGGHDDIGIAGQDDEAGRDRLQLQRDIGKDADHNKQRHNGGERLALAEPCRNKVGNRGDVLGLADTHDLAQHEVAQGEQQDRTEINRNKIIARGRGQSDTAVEGPGRAVDRERKRINHRLGALAGAKAFGLAVPPGGDRKQDSDIAERRGEDRPVVQHVQKFPGFNGALSTNLACASKKNVQGIGPAHK